MEFSHPLARGAKVWPSLLNDGTPHQLLVVVTTLQLDSSNRKYKPDKVDRLREAVREWLADHASEADGYLLLNRLKDWDSGKA